MQDSEVRMKSIHRRIEAADRVILKTVTADVGVSTASMSSQSSAAVARAMLLELYS